MTRDAFGHKCVGMSTSMFPLFTLSTVLKRACRMLDSICNCQCHMGYVWTTLQTMLMVPWTQREMTWFLLLLKGLWKWPVIFPARTLVMIVIQPIYFFMEVVHLLQVPKIITSDMSAPIIAFIFCWNFRGGWTTSYNK